MAKKSVRSAHSRHSLPPRSLIVRISEAARRATEALAAATTTDGFAATRFAQTATTHAVGPGDACAAACAAALTANLAATRAAGTVVT